MTTAIAFTANHIRKEFYDAPAKKTIEALKDISLTVPAGQITAIIGPDGAGKTTLLRLICGLLAPTAGSLSVLETDVLSDPQAVQDRLSYMPQRFGLYEDLSVAENLTLYADLHGVLQEDRQKRFAKLLHMTGLTAFTDRLAGKLSGGMKQKLGLACTLVRSPDLLILDEPTVGVDPLSRRELWEILQTLQREEGLSILVSTTYMDEAERCSHLIILYEGSILREGTPAEISALSAGLVFNVTPPPQVPSRIVQAALLDDKEQVIDAVPDGSTVRFSLYRQDQLPQLALLKKYPQLTAAPISSRLEDSFMMLLRQAAQTKESTAAFPVSYKDSYELPPEIVIEVRHLVRKFGDFTAVSDSSFQVRRGEIFGLLGPNGAGKSTTFRMLCGLLPATSGTLSVAGTDLRTARAAARANVGYVAQKFSLYPILSVKENLEFYSGIYGLRRKEAVQRIAEVTEQFELTDYFLTPAGILPGGFKQRLSMAAALLHKPPLLFLDEPTSGIDPLARCTFWRRITSLADTGTTIIVTTHFMEEAEYCDRMMIQDHGTILALGTPQEIRGSTGQNATMNEAFIAIVEQSRKEAEQP